MKSGEDAQPWKLVKTWKLDHVQTREDDKFHNGNRFSVSESGAVGISCFESPSLSVMYPDTDIPPVVLSNRVQYFSATFVKVSGKEYLAVSCREDGCLYLWDIESKISKKVFDPNLPIQQRGKDMNIFKINDNTIGYGEMSASPGGSRRVFILKTNTKELTLSSTLRLFTPSNIHDICYTEVDGGTPCLLLCLPTGGRIMAVEMIGGKTRWEAGKQQMGEKFKPYTICTDQNDCAYVADFGQDKIHLLSTTDGTVLRRIDGRNYGIDNIFGVRFHDQHLYVEHKINMSKYAIRKFKENKD